MTSTVLRCFCYLLFAVALVSCGDQGDSTSEGNGSAIPASEAANGPKPDKNPAPAPSEPAAEGLKVLTFDDVEMPEALEYKGQLQGGAHWQDLYGEHYLLLSSNSYNGEEGSSSTFYGEMYNTNKPGDNSWLNAVSTNIDYGDFSITIFVEVGDADVTVF